MSRWYVVLGLALSVYVFGLVISLAAFVFLRTEQELVIASNNARQGNEIKFALITVKRIQNVKQE